MYTFNKIKRVSHGLGSGKIEELQDLIEKTNAEIIVFNNELSASQIKNIEEEVKGDYE